MKASQIDLSDASKGFLALNPQLKGLGSLQIRQQGAPGSLAAPSEGPKRSIAADKRSYAEKAMELYLKEQLRKGEIESYAFEAVTLKVGEPRCRYTPDFFVILPGGKIRFIECKGRKAIWEDGTVKFKSAKRQYPVFEWEFWHIAKGLFERKF